MADMYNKLASRSAFTILVVNCVTCRKIIVYSPLPQNSLKCAFSDYFLHCKLPSNVQQIDVPFSKNAMLYADQMSYQAKLTHHTVFPFYCMTVVVKWHLE